jgi:hypothetical protein
MTLHGQLCRPGCLHAAVQQKDASTHALLAAANPAAAPDARRLWWQSGVRTLTAEGFKQAVALVLAQHPASPLLLERILGGLACLMVSLKGHAHVPGHSTAMVYAAMLSRVCTALLLRNEQLMVEFKRALGGCGVRMSQREAETLCLWLETYACALRRTEVDGADDLLRGFMASGAVASLSSAVDLLAVAVQVGVLQWAA